jgi:hypothetical protein
MVFPLCAGFVLLTALGCQMPRATPVPSTIALQTQAGAFVGTVHLEPGKPPALWPLRTIDGVDLTRAFPFQDHALGERHDHPHHRSMWAAHGDVNGVDFWHGDGRIEHDSIDFHDGECVVHGRWLDGQGVGLLGSTLSYRVVDKGNIRHVDMELLLSPIDGPVMFGDTKEGTLAIRLAPQLRVDGAVATGTLVNSAGETGAAVWGKPASWIEVTGTVDDAPVSIRLKATCTICDVSGTKTSLPVRWHARTYGLIAANPFGERAFDLSGEAKATRLEPGQRLVLTILVMLEDA